MHGEDSATVHVDSEVPQSTILGPLIFLLFIYDIGDDNDPSIKLLANDCLLFWIIPSTEDSTTLQKDLNTLHVFSNC